MEITGVNKHELQLNWETNFLGEICQISAGGDLDKDDFSAYPTDSCFHPIFSNALEDDGLYGYSAVARNKANAVTISARGTIGFARFRPTKFTSIGRLLVLYPKTFIDARYLSYFINDRISFVSETTGVPQLTAPQASKYLVSYPPLKEQQAIAEALSDSDALIASLEKLIEKKSKIQNSLANTLLIGSENNSRFKRIDELVAISTGGRNTQDKKPDGAYPFFVRSQQIERIDTFTYDKEAVLTAGDGVGTGKIYHYINGKFDAHQRVYILSDFKDDVVGRYFYWQFKFRFYERIMSMTAKSSVDSVRRKMIADLSLPVPSVSKQKEIVLKLDDAESEITLLNLQLNKAKKVKAGMTQELLTGRVRLI